MEFLLTKLDHSSKDDVQFAYEIYEKTLDSEYNIRNIRDIIIMRRKEEAKRQIDLKSIVSLQSDKESQQNAIDTKNDGASYDSKEKADAPKKENNKFNSIIEKIVNIIGEYLGIDIGKLCKRKSRENDKDDRERHRSTKREKKKNSKYNKKKQREELIVQKLGKKGRRKGLKDINLMEFIKEYAIEKNEEAVTLSVTLPAGSTTNVNPSLLADEIQKQYSEEIYYVLLRKELYLEDMTEFR